MHVKPAEGRAVRDPALRDLLPSEGRSVVNTDYWQRRLRDGDVEAVQSPPAASGKSSNRGA